MARQVFGVRRALHHEQDDSAVVPLNREFAGPQSVGDFLRNTREAQGHARRDLAQALCIREAYIAAIEEGRVDLLPGPTYAVGFVRTYADHLGLDADAIVERFKDETAALEDQTQLVFPSPMPEGRVPSGAVLMIAIVLAAFAYGGWLYLSSENRSVADLIPDLPERWAALIEPGQKEVAAAIGIVTDQDVAAAQPSQADGERTLPPENSLAEVQPGTVEATAPAPILPYGGRASMAAQEPTEMATAALAPVAPAPAAPLAPDGAAQIDAAVSGGTGAGAAAVRALPPSPPASSGSLPHEYGSGETDVRIVIKAREDSWIDVRDADNRPLLARLLRAGDSYRVPNDGGLVMMTNNAGGIVIEVDGVAVPDLGPMHAIRRNIALEPDRLRQGQAAAQ